MMASLSQSGSFSIPRDAYAAIAWANSLPGGLTSRNGSPPISRVYRETGYVLDPHTAVAVAVSAKVEHSARVPQVVLLHRPPAKFPKCGGSRHGQAPGTAAPHGGSDDAQGALDCPAE